VDVVVGENSIGEPSALCEDGAEPYREGSGKFAAAELWRECVGYICEGLVCDMIGDEGQMRSSTILSSSSISSRCDSRSDTLSSMTEPRLFKLATLELRARDPSERSQPMVVDEEGVRQVGVFEGA